MMKGIFLFTSFFVTVLSFAQERTKFQALDTIAGKYSAFSVDNFGRIYLTKEDVLYQHYEQNDTVFTASLKSIRPTSIESSKAFRILVFDSERSIIRFYDNTLTDINGEIDLVDFGIQQPLLVCESFAGNSFWVLDGALMRMVKLNQSLEVVSQTENLVRIFDQENLPSQMLEYNDFLYVLIPGKGVAIFDVFGTFVKIYPTKATAIGALNNYLLLMSEEKIEAISNDAFLGPDFTYSIPKGVKSFFFGNKKVYFLMESKVVIGNYVKAN